MKLQYLGTAAAEAIPALFCQCDICRAARRNGGRDIRGRSGAIIDGVLMIDFPPDIYLHVLRHNLDLAKVENLLITHSHNDHFDGQELMMRMPGCYCHITEGEQVLHVYGNEEVGRLFFEAQRLEFGRTTVDFLTYAQLAPFVPVTVGGYRVTALPARHKLDEHAYFYLVQKDGKGLLYAHDTGLFYDEVYDYLARCGGRLDIVSLDCTSCARKDGANHMGLPDNLEVLARLRSQGNVDDATKCVVNHFSHNSGMLYEQMCEAARPHGLLVSYDGMVVEG